MNNYCRKITNFLYRVHCLHVLVIATLVIIFPQSVFAQSSCTGTPPSCWKGKTVYSCTSPGGGGSGTDCASNLDCPVGQECHPFPFCDSADTVAGSCSAGSCGNTCPAGYCTVGGSCNVVAPPTSTPRPGQPTSTPAPTATPDPTLCKSIAGQTCETSPPNASCTLGTGACDPGKTCYKCGGPPKVDCDTFSGKGYSCGSAEGTDWREWCTTQDMKDGKYRMIANDITNNSTNDTIKARQSCGLGGSAANSGAGKNCIAKCPPPPLDLCIMNFGRSYNPDTIRLSDSNRFDIGLSNLPSACAYWGDGSESAQNSCAGIKQCRNDDAQTTKWRLGSKTNLSHPSGGFCQEGCTRASCTSNDDIGAGGASNSSGWTWEDVARYDKVTAPVEICCQAWAGPLNRVPTAVPICQRLGKATGTVSPAIALTNSPIKFTFKVTDADVVPPEVRLHTFHSSKFDQNDADQPWGVFWDRWIAWAEDPSKIMIASDEQHIHNCSLNKLDNYTWEFTCTTPTASEFQYDRDRNDPNNAIQTINNYASHSVVFTNKYNVETIVSYELVPALPPATPTPTLTPLPPCTIQGFKVTMPGNRNVLPASVQTITLDGATSLNTNSYIFNTTSGGHTVTASLPAPNYAIGYTTCENAIDCHTSTPTLGTFAPINCPAVGPVSNPLNPYNDLWFHYYEIEGWYKLSNASLHKNNNIFNYFPNPANLAAFDGDDTTDPFLIVHNAGVITTNGAIDLGPYLTQVSAHKWSRTAYTKQSNYLDNISLYVAYVRARKKFKVITDPSNMERDMLHILVGDVTINNPSQIDKDNSVLLVQGNITIGPMPGNKLNVSGRSIALIATGAISIHSSVTDINAILIANSVDIASDLSGSTQSPNTLKVNGNLISNTAINAPLERERANYLQPSLFVVFNPKMYLDILPYLSTIVREGREIQ